MNGMITNKNCVTRGDKKREESERQKDKYGVKARMHSEIMPLVVEPYSSLNHLRFGRGLVLIVRRLHLS